MMYLTLGEGFSGVLSSQVCGTARYIDEHLGERVQVGAFVSLRNYLSERRAFREGFARTWAVPSWPRLAAWRKNLPSLQLLTRLSGERRLITRGIFANQLALDLRDRGHVESVCFDGRGAYAAEWAEYLGSSSSVPRRLLDEIPDLERDAVLRSDFRIAVSEALVDYWRSEHDYAGDDHVVVPCAIHPELEATQPSPERRSELRRRHGFAEGDAVLAFAGRMAGWQSLTLLDEVLAGTLEAHPHAQALLLADIDPGALRAAREHPDRVHVAWVKHDEVFDLLCACDHGLLLREPTVTNRVAAPTKFAEYLAAGLDVLVSPGIGDYSGFVEEHGCGRVVDGPVTDGSLQPLSPERRSRNRDLALAHFTKSAHAPAYRRVLQALGGRADTRTT